MKKKYNTPKQFRYPIKTLIIILAFLLSISILFAQYSKNTQPPKDSQKPSIDPIKFSFIPMENEPGPGFSVFIENENEKKSYSDKKQWITKFKQAGQDITEDKYNFTLDNRHLPNEFKQYPLKKYTLFFKNKYIPMKFQKLIYSSEDAYQLFTIQLEPDTPSSTNFTDKEKCFILQKPHPPIQTSQVSEVVTITPTPQLSREVKQKLKKHFSDFLKKTPRKGIFDTTNPDGVHFIITPGKIHWFTIKSKPNYKFIISVWHDNTDTDNSYTFAVVGVFLLIGQESSIKLTELIPLALEEYPCLEIYPYAYLKINDREFIQVEKRYLENSQNHIYEISTNNNIPWKHHAQSFYYGL